MPRDFALPSARCHRRSRDQISCRPKGQKQFMRTWTQEKHQEWINKSNFDRKKVQPPEITGPPEIHGQCPVEVPGGHTISVATNIRTSPVKHCASHFQIPVGVKTCTGQGYGGNHIATVANNKIWSHKNGRAVLSSQIVRKWPRPGNEAKHILVFLMDKKNSYNRLIWGCTWML